MTRKSRISYIIIISLISILVLSFSLPSSVMAAAGDETTAGSITVLPTIECIGVAVTYSGDNNQNNSAVLQYRESGGSWKTAPEMYADRANREYRGSIFWLTTNTQYEVRVTFSDTDGVSGSPVQTTTTTMNDSPAIGTNYIYVSTNGNDSTGDGSIDNPWRTIQKASDISSPGSTILVRGGTYSEEVSIAVAGTPGAYITYMPYPGEAVTLEGNGTLGRLFYISYKDYIRIKGFTIQNTAFEPAIFIQNSNYVIVEDNTITNCNVGGDADFGCIQLYSTNAFLQGPSNCIIQNNTITMNIPGQTNVSNGIGFYIPCVDTGYSHSNVYRYNTITSPNHSLRDGIGGGPESGSLSTKQNESSDVYGNFVSGAADDGIQMEGGGRNVRIWNNRVEDALAGIAMAPVEKGPQYVFRNTIFDTEEGMFKQGRGSLGRLYLYHNSFYTPQVTSDGYIKTNNGLENVISINNVIYARRYIFESGGGLIFDYDLMWTTDPTRFIKWDSTLIHSLEEFQARGFELHGIAVPDFKFVDADSGDLTMQPDSPAIDAGTVLPGFNDADSPWPYTGSAPDIGAYEYESLEPMPPVLAPIGDKTTHPGWTLQFTVSATDPNNDTLIYSAGNLPDGAAFDPGTHTFSWTPTVDQLGSWPGVHFEVTDSTFIDSEDITINVTENQAPSLANPGDKTASEGSPLNFTLSASDPDNDTLIYSANNLPPGATLNESSGAFAWTPDYNQAGTFTDIQFIVSDSEFSDSENITITVNNTNRAPVLASIGNKTVTEGQTLQFTVSAIDPDGDPLVYSASNLPVGASFNTTTRLFAWVPLEDQIDTHTGVHFEATDNKLSDYENITITVKAASANPTGGGGGGGGGGSGGTGATSLSGMMNGEGKIVIDVLCTVDDQEIKIIIPKETIVKRRDGRNATYIRIDKSTQATKQAQYSQTISTCYDITPNGVTFDPAATIVFKYDPRVLPRGLSENSLYIAQYDTDNREWIYVGGVVDPDACTVTAQIEHLSYYALLADVWPASFSFSDLSVSSESVLPGETITASVVVNNQGNLYGNCAVELKLDNAAIQTENIELAGGTSETVTFAIASDITGYHRVSIGNVSGTFSVIEPKSPAAFTVSGLKINPDTVNPGENTDISVIVTNNGELAGSYQATLKINGAVVQTKEVTINGGESATVSFGISPNSYGVYQVSIGGLVESFEVKPEPPPLGTGVTITTPEVKSFSITPIHDEATHKLVYAKIVYQVNQNYTSMTDTRMVLAVFHGGELLEEVPLLTLSQLQADGRTGQLQYIPSEGWEIGEYSFRAELYQGENLIQDTPLQNLIVTPESITKTVSWWTLGVVIGIAVILIIAFISVIIYRRRDMLEEY